MTSRSLISMTGALRTAMKKANTIKKSKMGAILKPRQLTVTILEELIKTSRT